MRRFIVLDSTPMGLLLQRSGPPPVDQCRQWLAQHLADGASMFVPEIIDCEVRRELLRLKKQRALRELDAFNAAAPDRLLSLTSATLRRAAELWAQARQRGRPTADPHALDIDVILAAQVLSSGLPLSDLVVATSNVSHLAQFVPAQEWSSIA